MYIIKISSYLTEMSRFKNHSIISVRVRTTHKSFNPGQLVIHLFMYYIPQGEVAANILEEEPL